MTHLKDQFLLNDKITFLNFGSFGAAVKPVFEKYQAYQLELEQEPVQFITVRGPKLLAESRQALGDYVSCADDDLVYVTNPSYAVNTVAKSFPLIAGDEVLATNIEYGACDKVWNYYCQKAGAKYIRQPITYPPTSKEQFIEEFVKGITPKTKLIFISHITSATALRLPVEEICAIAKEKGILTFVDGAHVPAQIDLNLQNSPFDFYTGACHKWMMTAKGSSFLYAKKEHQALLDPLVISWGYDALFPSHSQFLDYHQMNGTRDFSAFLTIPTAIKFMQENDWQKVRKDCINLCLNNIEILKQIIGFKENTKVDENFIVQMYAAPVPTSQPEKLKQLLYDQYQIEIPVMRQDDQNFIRFSIQAFNSQADLDRLYEALTDIKKKTNLIETR